MGSVIESRHAHIFAFRFIASFMFITTDYEFRIPYAELRTTNLCANAGTISRP